MNKRKTVQVIVGDVKIGGNASVTIQSMTNTDTRDIEATVEQIARLEEAGCQLVRCAVLDMEAAHAIEEIKKRIKIPIIADIHFDYRLAIEAVRSGADKIRINPGNIGGQERLKKVLSEVRERAIPIRLGVNSGSLEKEILKKYRGVTPEALAESAAKTVRIVEDLDFRDIIVSIKASDVKLNYHAHKIFTEIFDYPMHIGITEAGTINSGKIKSAIGIGSLLLEGIGDTVRVSLTGDPVEEVKYAKDILETVGLRKTGIDLISCPTCGRTRVDLIEIVGKVEERLEKYRNSSLYNQNRQIKLAVMGCEVNGPGEAASADLGIAYGKERAVIFKNGEIIGTYSDKEDQGLDMLFELLEEEIKL